MLPGGWVGQNRLDDSKNPRNDSSSITHYNHSRPTPNQRPQHGQTMPVGVSAAARRPCRSALCVVALVVCAGSTGPLSDELACR